ncbi:MMPL family transporter, partial [Propionibacterium freudenreichii]|nr:MMPL family transporter [Propionibacterium freudenreichii]
MVLGITGSLALTGWGGQNLFSRLTSSETNVPDTDSQHVADTVAEARGSSTTVTIVVTGVDVRTHRAQAGELVATLRDKLDVEHVASVTDAFSVLARVPGTDPALAQADPAAARAAAEATA